MMLPVNGVRIYLALGATDMRKSIDGLEFTRFCGHHYHLFALII